MPPARARGRAVSRQTAGNRRCEPRSRRETSSFPRRSTPWEASRSPPPGRNRTVRRRSDRHSAPSATPSSGSRQLWHRRTMLSPLWFRLCRLRDPLIKNRAVVTAGLVTERTGKPTLADPGGPAQDQIVMRVDPFAAGELLEQSAVEAARGSVIDVLHTGLLAQFGIAQPGGKPLVAAMGELAIEQEAEPIGMGERTGFVGGFEL